MVTLSIPKLSRRWLASYDVKPDILRFTALMATIVAELAPPYEPGLNKAGFGKF